MPNGPDFDISGTYGQAERLYRHEPYQAQSLAYRARSRARRFGSYGLQPKRHRSGRQQHHRCGAGAGLAAHDRGDADERAGAAGDRVAGGDPSACGAARRPTPTLRLCRPRLSLRQGAGSGAAGLHLRLRRRAPLRLELARRLSVGRADRERRAQLLFRSGLERALPRPGWRLCIWLRPGAAGGGV